MVSGCSARFLGFLPPVAFAGFLALWCAAAPALGGISFDARSARSGKWSDPATWENSRTPRAGVNVQIRSGHEVTYDVPSGPPIRILHIAGTLTFSRDTSTTLEVGLIRIEAGEEVSEDGFECDMHGAKEGDPEQKEGAALE